jgi:hypothetical protein
MKLVPGRQGFARVELHPFDPLAEPPQGRSPVSTVGVIVDWLDDEAHTLGFTQRQFVLGRENTMCVDRFYDLSHSFVSLSPE